MSLFSSIRTKLLGVVLLLALVSAGIGLMAWRSLAAANERLNHIVGVTAEAQSLPGRIRANFTRAHREEKSMLLSDSPADFDKHFDLAEAAHAHTRELVDELEKVVSGQTLEEFRRFKQAYEEFIEVSNRVIELARQNSDGQAYALSRTRGDLLHDEADAFLQSLVDRTEHLANEDLGGAGPSDGSARDGDVAAHLLTIEYAQHIHKAWIRLRQIEKSYILSLDTGVKDEYARRIESQFDLIAERSAALAPKLGDADRQLLQRFAAKSDEWRQSNEEIRRLSRLATREQAERISETEGEAAFQRARDALMKVIDLAGKTMEDEVALARKEYASAVKVKLGMGAVGIAAAVGISLWIVGGITGTLSGVLERMRAIAAGDLAGDPIRVTTRDEIGQLAKATNEMQSGLRAIVINITSTSEQVSAAATQVAATSEQMAASSEHQRAQLTQVAAAIEEMAATVTEVSGRTGEVSRQSTDAGNQATEGGEIVRRTVEEMGQIASQVDSTSTAVGALSEKAVQIGEILTVINDIADQTNLLALNAAIEAARAGEHGRGFAVVADEVRKLAERTQEATQEVSRSIGEIQTSTGEATEMMNASKDRVSQGVHLARQAGESLESIVRGSNTVAQSIDSIAAAVEEQSATSAEIARSIEVISASADEATQGANQAAAAATQLSGNAESLRELVSRFRV